MKPGERLVEATPGGAWKTSTLVHAVALDGTRAAMVLDNLSSHKSSSAIAAVEKVGAKMIYLPPYSPDLNPIENIFSKVKQLIRGYKPRTRSEIIKATKDALLRVTTDDLTNAFLHCGYSAM